jgi:hypothetical protein
MLNVTPRLLCTRESQRLAADQGDGLSLDLLERSRQLLTIRHRIITDMAKDDVSDFMEEGLVRQDSHRRDRDLAIPRGIALAVAIHHRERLLLDAERL